MEDSIKVPDIVVGADAVRIKQEPEDLSYIENEGENNFYEEADASDFKEEARGKKKINGNGEILEHVAIREDPEIFLAEEMSCVEVGSRENFIRPFLKTDTSGLCSRKYICYHCKRRKRSVKSLKSHIKEKHLGKDNKNYPERKEKEGVKRKQRRRKKLFGRCLRGRKRGEAGKKKRIPCHLCNYSTPYPYVLRSHILGVHTDARPFKCPFCDYSTAYARVLQVHVQSVHIKEKPYRCHERGCKYSTAISSHLKSHIRGVHSGERPHRCSFCEYSTAYPMALRRHTMALHTSERPYHCPDCDYKSAYASDLKLHIMNHHRLHEKPHQCPFCPYNSGQISHMKNHINAVHTKNQLHKCPNCPFFTAYPFVLKSHLSTFHSERTQNIAKNSSSIETNYDEYSLASGFSNDNRMDLQGSAYFSGHPATLDGLNHNAGSDPGDSGTLDEELESNSSNPASSEAEDPLETCNLEDQAAIAEDLSKSSGTFNSSQVEDIGCSDPLADINQSNSGPVIMQVALNPFDYALSSSFDDPAVGSQLKKKRRRKRERNKEKSQEKQYPCPQCDYCFQKLKHLMYHMKGEHPGVKSFPCTQCDFTAPKSSLLKYHVQAVHKAAAGATVHQCPKCPYCSGSIEKLHTHIRVKHNRIRPYKCPQCSYSSTQAGHIKIHVRAKHTDEKPYHCSYCGYQSAYASALKSHITKRHTNN